MTIELQQPPEELVALYKSLSYLFLARDTVGTSQRIVEAVTKEFRHVDCGLLIPDYKTSEITRVARIGVYQVVPNVPLYLEGPGLVPQALRERRTVYAADVSASVNYQSNYPQTRSELVIPLQTPVTLIGALDLQSTELNAFNEHQIRILEAFAEHAALALENAQLYTEISRKAEELEAKVIERTLELQQLLTQERELSEMKSRFVSIASHEFRTPLTVILSSAGILKMGNEQMPSENRLKHLDRIELSVNTMTRLLEDVLTVGKVSSGDLKLQPKLLDLQALCLSVIEDVDIGRQRVRFSYSGDFCQVAVDEKLFRQAASNLLSNALKYSPSNSVVDCTLECNSQNSILQVSDKGVGIPEKDQKHLFETFYRASNVGNQSGTGLGLTIVKYAVELHNGTIDFQSREGLGTTFTVTIPIKSTDHEVNYE